MTHFEEQNNGAIAEEISPEEKNGLWVELENERGGDPNIMREMDEINTKHLEDEDWELISRRREISEKDLDSMEGEALRGLDGSLLDDRLNEGTKAYKEPYQSRSNFYALIRGLVSKYPKEEKIKRLKEKQEKGRMAA